MYSERWAQYKKTESHNRKLTKLRILQIWQIADVENRGLLTPAGFGIVLRLIGYAQAGRQVSAELALKRERLYNGTYKHGQLTARLTAGGPLPKFDGITAPFGPPPSAAQPLQAQSSGGPIRIPPLTPDKVTQYSSLFEESGAQNGMLSGTAHPRLGELSIADVVFQVKQQSKYSNEPNYQTMSLVAFGILRTENRKDIWG